MSHTPPRANPFGDLNDFTELSSPKPVSAEAIEKISQASGFPSRKAHDGEALPLTTKFAKSEKAAVMPSSLAKVNSRPPRRRTTGRNRQINIKATEETIEELYRIADELDLPLGAVLERALAALRT